MARVIEDGYVCVNCLLMMTNGDYSAELSQAAVEYIAECTAGWYAAEDDKYPNLEFSRSRCACCRSTLGGNRFWAVKLGD